jgi:hypothetical protein
MNLVSYCHCQKFECCHILFHLYYGIVRIMLARRFLINLPFIILFVHLLSERCCDWDGDAVLEECKSKNTRRLLHLNTML